MSVKPRNLQDYMALFSRRRLWIGATFMFLSGAAVLATKLIPPIYQSGATILIRPRDVPTEFVKSLSVASADERLKMVERTILSRTNLLKILDEYGNGAQFYRGLSDDRKIAKFKKRIKVETTTERIDGGYPTTTDFHISYRDQEPKITYLIAARLASLFIAQDRATREKQISSTTEFLSDELHKIEKKLQDSDRELKAQTNLYRNELPSQVGTNLSMLNQLQYQKGTTLEAIDRKTSALKDIERQLATTPEKIPQGTQVAEATGTEKDHPLVDAYLDQEKAYKELLQKGYTSKHPDVQRAKANLEQLKQEIPDNQLQLLDQKLQKTPPVMVPNPAYRALTDQAQQLKTDLRTLQSSRQRVEADIERYVTNLGNTPGISQQMATSMRINGELIRQQEDLKNRLLNAQMARNLESGDLGSQFVIVDPANYPDDPISPRPVILLGAGLLFSLCAGLAVAIIADVADQRIWTQHDLERYDARVLVEIPSICSSRDLACARKNRLAHAALAILLCTAYLAVLVYIYEKPSSVRRFIDPLVETLLTRNSASQHE